MFTCYLSVPYDHHNDMNMTKTPQLDYLFIIFCMPKSESAPKPHNTGCFSGESASVLPVTGGFPKNGHQYGIRFNVTNATHIHQVYFSLKGRLQCS